MKKIIIKNWQQYGNYMLFANLVDKIGKWILLESTDLKITATGKDEVMDEFSKLLKRKRIDFEWKLSDGK